MKNSRTVLNSYNFSIYKGLRRKIKLKKKEKEEEDRGSVNTWTANGSSNAYAYEGIPAAPVFTMDCRKFRRYCVWLVGFLYREHNQSLQRLINTGFADGCSLDIYEFYTKIFKKNYEEETEKRPWKRKRIVLFFPRSYICSQNKL